MRRALISLVLLVATAATASADLQSDWDGLLGDWRGQGMVRQDPLTPLEPGACSAQVSRGDGPRTLVIEGRCANATRTARFRTEVTAIGAANRVRAVSQSKAFAGTAELHGQWRAGGVELVSAAPVSVRDRSYDLHLSISFAAGKQRFALVQALSPAAAGKPEVVLDMDFKRK